MVELIEFETVFGINVNVFTLHKCTQVSNRSHEDTYAEIARESTGIHPATLNLSLWERHFSYIKNISQYCNKFICKICNKFFKRGYEYSQHLKIDCGSAKHIFPGGVYTPDESIFDLLEAEGIDIAGVDRFYPYRIIFDTEAFQATKYVPDSTESIVYTANHLIASAAVISNVPGYTEPKVFMVSDHINGHEVVVHMLQYMLMISDEGYRFLDSLIWILNITLKCYSFFML